MDATRFAGWPTLIFEDHSRTSGDSRAHYRKITAGKTKKTPIDCSGTESVQLTCTETTHAWKAHMTTISYSHARENLASIWDQVEDSREEVILQRRGHEDLALLPADELQSLKETAYLLRSPRNAVRLLRALERSRAGGGREFSSIDELKAAVET
jgi:antitoxin YefM